MGNKGSNELSVVFVNGSSIPLAKLDWVGVIWRREILILVFSSLAMFAVLPGLFSSDLLSLAVQVCAMGFAGLVFLVLMSGGFGLVERATGSLSVSQLYEPVLTVPCALAAGMVDQQLELLLTSGPAGTRLEMALELVSAVLLFEALTMVIFVFIAPVSAQHRMGKAGKSAAQKVRIGQLELDPDEILQIDSRDHYLRIHTPTALHETIARLSDAKVLLGDRGMLVHRSHWVALRLFGSVAQDGRRYELSTTDGRTVPVSRARYQDVMAFIEGPKQAAP